MFKKIGLLVMVIIVTFMMFGCISGDRAETNYDTKFQMLLNTGSCFVFTFQDPNTKVWYISTSEGVCPRYNADGSLYVETNER